MAMAILPPTELMLITRPLLRIKAGRSACVTAMWPKKLTSNRRRHSSIAKTSTGALTADGGVVHQRPHCPALRVLVHPSCQRLDVIRVGDVEDQRLYAGPPDCVGVLVAPDAREDVEPPPGQFARRGRADAARRTGYDGDLLDFR